MHDVHTHAHTSVRADTLSKENPQVENEGEIFHQGASGACLPAPGERAVRTPSQLHGGGMGFHWSAPARLHEIFAGK